MPSRPTLVSSARVLCYINGKLYSKVTSFTWNSATPRKVIRTIDIPHPVELAATTTEITWQMGVIRQAGDGGLQGAGIVAAQIDISKEKYFSLVLIERTTGLTLFKCDMCSTSGENWSIQAKNLMSGSLSGSAILWTNEAST